MNGFAVENGDKVKGRTIDTCRQQSLLVVWGIKRPYL